MSDGAAATGRVVSMPGEPRGGTRRPAPARGEGAMAAPHSPRHGAYVVRVEEGRRYRWCRCGLSRNQPWCDDSHAGTGFEPVAFVAPVTAEFHMCGCKGSDNPPWCFGNCTGNAARRR